MSPAEHHALRLLEVKRDMERVARAYYGTRWREGMAPPMEVQRRHGRYTPHRIRKMAGCLPWAKAVRVYGLTPVFAACRAPLSLSRRRAIIAALHRVAALTGAAETMPKVRDFERLSDFGREDVRELVYGGEMGTRKRSCADVWEKAADEAGLKARRRFGRQITRAKIISDYRYCASDFWRTKKYQQGGPGPLRVEFLRSVSYGDRQIRNTFPGGGFAEMVREAGFVPRQARGGWRKKTLDKVERCD